MGTSPVLCENCSHLRSPPRGLPWQASSNVLHLREEMWKEDTEHFMQKHVEFPVSNCTAYGSGAQGATLGPGADPHSSTAW